MPDVSAVLAPTSALDALTDISNLFSVMLW